MKRYLKDYILTINKVEEAIYDCFKRKWKRKSVAYFLADYFVTDETDKDKVAQYCHTLAKSKETRPQLYETISRAAYALFLEIENRAIVLQPIRYETRYDATSDKIREIGISSIKQQIFDYIAVNACKEMFMAKIGYYQCASLPKRGQIYGKKAIERWVRNDYTNGRYYYKCDIKKYYPSVNKNKLKAFLCRDVKNKDIIFIIQTLLNTYKQGLCIGSYLSQFLANYYLSYAYHYITEKSYSIRKRKNGERVRVNHIKHILFYMDDVIMFSSSLKQLQKAVTNFKRYIEQVLLLTVKPTDAIFRTRGNPIDMMGYVVSIKNTIIRPKIYRKIHRVYIRVKRKSINISRYIARKIVSYYGYIKYSDLYLFSIKYHVKEIVTKAKEVISYYDKKRIYRETRQLQLF